MNLITGKERECIEFHFFSECIPSRSQEDGGNAIPSDVSFVIKNLVAACALPSCCEILHFSSPDML